MGVRHWDIIEATFTPRRTDDLRHDAAQFIGVRCQWIVGPPVKDGPYEGEFMCDPHGKQQFRIGWVPSGDLTDVKYLSHIS